MSSLLSLESRIMFDGAAVATAGAVTSEQLAQDHAHQAVSVDDAATGDTLPSAPTGEPQFTTDEQALFDALAAYDASAARQEIVFVSSSVREYQKLLDGISPNVEVHILDSSRDGVEQMSEVLAGRTGIDAIHLIGHGTEGEMELGSSLLTQASIGTQYAEQLQQISRTLSADADILIYGCNFGQGEAGQAAIHSLALLTGADVAASTDATGHIELGGDWVLEAQTGSIETDIAIDHSAQDNWSDLLGVVDWDAVTWTGGTTAPASQVITLSDGSTVTVSVTETGAGTLTSITTANNYTGGLSPVQDALQFGMTINPTTDTITVRIDFSNQLGGSVSNVSLTLFDVDNDEFAIFNSNVGNPTSATTSTTNTFNGTNTISGNGAGANQTTNAGNTTITFGKTGITWVEFTYGSTSNSSPIVVLHDILFNSTTAGGPTLDLNDNDAAQSASDNFDDTAPFTGAYNNPSGGTIPWSTNWIEVDGVGAAQSATAGEVRIVDVDATAGVDGEIRIGRDTGAASSIQRSVNLTNYINPTLSFNYNTSGTLENADSLVVEVSKDAGVTFTTLQTFTNDSTGVANLNLAGYESADTIIRFRVTGGYTAADEFFFVDNVTISAEPTGHTVAYTENGSAVGISDTDVVITDPSSANMSGGTVSIARNFTAGDTLTFTNIGNITGSYNALTGVLTITGVDTRANYQTFLASVRYSSTSDDPTAGGTATTRTISTIVRDQTTQLPSNTALTTVTITAVNDAPVVDLNAGGAGQDVTTAFTEQTPVLIAPVGTLTDVDSANLTSLTVTLTARPDGNAVEGLSLNAAATTAATGAGLTVSYTPATGVLSITGSATTAVYQTILQGIQYSNTSDAPTTSNRSITVVANDGALPSGTQTVTLTVAAVNDAPVVDLNAGGAGQDVTTAFTEQTPVLIAPVGTLTDVDSANLTSLTVTLTARPDGNAVEGLSLNAAATTAATGAGLTVSYTPATGVLSITGSATTAVYQTILQGIQYSNTSDAPTTSNRSITVVANDGALPSGTQTVTLTVAAVNDAPDIADATVSLNENSPNGTAVYNVSDSFTGTDLDRDGTAITYSIVGGNTGGAFAIDSATGVITVADSSILNRESLPSFNLTIQASDGSLTDTATITINLTDVDEFDVGPISDINGVVNAVNENVATGTLVGTTAFTSDADATTNAITYSLTDNAGGRFQIDGSTGIVTVLNAALLDYESATSHNITVRADSADGSFSTQTYTVNVTNANEAPVLGGDATVNVAENTTAVGTFAATDPDAGDTITYTLSGADAGLFSISAAGVVTFNAAPDFEVNPGPFTFTVTATDVGGLLDTQNVTVQVTDVNEGPPTAPSPPILTVPPSLLPIPNSGPGSVPPVSGPISAPPPISLSTGNSATLVLQPPPVNIQTVGAPDELVKRVGPASQKFLRTEKPDIAIQEPMPLWIEPLSLPVKKMLESGRKMAANLDRLADDLARSMQERERQAQLMGRIASFSGIALSAGFSVWILRGGSLLMSFLVSMPVWRHFDPVPVLGISRRDRKKIDRQVRAAQQQENDRFRGLERVVRSESSPMKQREQGTGAKKGKKS